MATLPLDDKNEKPYTNCRLRDDATLSLYSSKQPKALWKDFSRKLSNYLEELLHSIEVKDVNSLKDLVLTNQLKRTVSRDVKGALFIIIWGDIKSSSELVQKLDHYEIARGKTSNHKVLPDSTSVNVLTVAINNCHLREDEGQELSGSQRVKLDSLIKNHHSIFEVGGETTPFIEHSINTENSPAISMPPYRMNPARKELLKKELDSLLKQGITLECESPYASPVVFISKPNGSMRICIDYRKLNTQTIPDSYPLLRMDDLLNEAKTTPYMSTIDLRSGYHQVKVGAEDQEETAFTCPFGIYEFTRMPLGYEMHLQHSKG
ncbi:retrovirus-related Pol polyprotein from transposon 297 [Trichonephila clavipes]|nr:retrovirus-related Pol polyprotein from transposon 297 [Trichonephila clavipes]